MDGGISVNGVKVTKPGTAIAVTAQIELISGWGQKKYASRGGLKLERALAEFAVDVTDRICLDVGASTGGFTDCLLQHGARKVYAIDVGYGQLDWRLRQDPRVVVKERINARNLTNAELYGQSDERADLAVADVSFISLLKVLPAVLSLLSPQPELICLIKPQFEAGKEAVSRGGVVRNAKDHVAVLESIIAQSAKLGLAALNLTFSPLQGPAGNIEYLIHWLSQARSVQIDVPSVVQEAFRVLTK